MKNGNLLTEGIIRFAGSLGARLINFHILIERPYYPLATWTTGPWTIPIREWVSIYPERFKSAMKHVEEDGRA